jgi:hypothetical protein
MTDTEAKWAERVRGWRASGQDATVFAEARGFKASTLRVWASRLRARARAVAVERRADRAAAPRMVRVKRTSRTTRAALVVSIGSARIEVSSGFDRALLSEVVEALGGAR